MWWRRRQAREEEATKQCEEEEEGREGASPLPSPFPFPPREFPFGRRGRGEKGQSAGGLHRSHSSCPSLSPSVPWYSPFLSPLPRHRPTDRGSPSHSMYTPPPPRERKERGESAPKEPAPRSGRKKKVEEEEGPSVLPSFRKRSLPPLPLTAVFEGRRRLLLESKKRTIFSRSPAATVGPTKRATSCPVRSAYLPSEPQTVSTTRGRV